MEDNMTDETEETPNKSHYELLLRCAQKEDFSEWNDFVSISDDVIKLRGADLSGLTLTSILLTNKKGKGADLYAANLENSKIDTIDFSKVHLSKVNFRNAKISNCLFSESTCIKTNFTSATFVLVNFSRANLHQADFRNTEFYECDFYEALFTMANVESAKFMGGGRNPFLKKEQRRNMCGASFNRAKFNNATYFDLFNISKNTDFRSSTFENSTFSCGLKQSLQYCNRRHNWIDWYRDQGHLKSFLVRTFWLHSDYGRSARHVIYAFLIASIFFASIYFLFPGLIKGLGTHEPVQSLYFSIVTMTTLGYGDMSASLGSWTAQCVIIAQVLYGYVLLGALVSLLANIFIADGPPRGLIKHPVPPVKIMIKTIKSI
ncbi:hypothetical protein CT157_11150 [Pseudomonas syringae]|uniref:Potassium channel domain-containing protein n=1 Tax=Pseudomonas syringae TaxID=317 RepID=A0A3T0JSX7_PSESX|nr:hypothetical protein CT157_11150 [Pseudomonas syringae]